jgi:hypothetical protein
MVPHDDVVAASGALVLFNGAGFLLGPLLGGALMHWLGSASLFAMIALSGAAMTVQCGLAVRRKRLCEPQSKRFVVVSAHVSAGAWIIRRSG